MNTSIPELSDEQIGSMRFAIMSDLNKSARSRTRRYRHMAVGAVAVVALGAIGAQVLGSTPGPNTSFSAYKSDDSAGSDSSREAATPLATSLAAPGTDRLSESGTADSARKVITTGSIILTVSDPAKSAQKIARWIESIGGRVDSRSEQAAEGNDGQHASLTVRIPQSKISGSIDKLGTFGKIESVALDENDVTSQAQDLDARIKALQISVGRLEDFMRTATSSSALLQSERALTDRQGTLESLAAERKHLNDQVRMSTISIDLFAKATAQGVGPSAGFRGGLVSGWNSLVTTIDGAVHGLGVILPWGIALGLVAGIAWLVTRRKPSGVS